MKQPRASVAEGHWNVFSPIPAEQVTRSTMLVLFAISFRRCRLRGSPTLREVAVFLLPAPCLLFIVTPQTPDPSDTIRIDTDLVNLNVSVFSRKSSQTTGPLQQKALAVFENGEPQEISFFASAETPFDLVLLLDLSGSTADKIGLIRKSAKRFVDAARPADRIAIFTFRADIHVVSTLASDHKALRKSIDSIEKPTGGTNFWDALRFVLEHVLGKSRAEKRRSAV